MKNNTFRAMLTACKGMNLTALYMMLCLLQNLLFAKVKLVTYFNDFL